MVIRPPAALSESALSLGRKHFDIDASPSLPNVSMDVRSTNTSKFFSAPRRGGMKVVEELAREFPSLRGQLREMLTEVSKLGSKMDYHRTLYSREITPRSFKRFDRCPEFNSLGRTLPAYERCPGAPD